MKGDIRTFSEIGHNLLIMDTVEIAGYNMTMWFIFISVAVSIPYN